MKTLVVYATKHGSTEEVAEFVAGALRADGHDVDLAPADGAPPLAYYDAIVLGAAIYMGRVHGDAMDFMRRNRDAFRGRRLAVFAMGPRTLEEHDVDASRHQLERALAHVKVEPVVTAIFGGVVNPERLRFPFSRIEASDARDWEAIADWAHGLSEVLRTPAAFVADG